MIEERRLELEKEENELQNLRASLIMTEKDKHMKEFNEMKKN